MWSILVVDDNPVVVRLLENLLERSGYRVMKAGNGEDALEIVAADKPDLVLLDIDMPGKSGYWICRSLKSNLHFADIPVLFVTALADKEDIVNGFAAGCQDYILKPFIHAELLARVQTHLALRKAHQDLQASVVRFRDLSILDDLTGFYNTRYLYQTLQEQLEKKRNLPLSVVFIDIDNFKHTVDTYGHLNGSNVIAELAEIVINLLPDGGYGVSYGGDEFVVVLAGHGSKEGAALAEKIRSAIERADFLSFCDLAVHITVSCGVATFPDDACTLSELLGNADQALFETKRRGKNKVVCFAEILENGGLNS
ncbi:MAG: diguanylate cyclase [Desulfocapsaceae bacterium]|nr:diguanylate cyclase [Desulfocapsaceae bacterium]